MRQRCLIEELVAKEKLMSKSEKLRVQLFVCGEMQLFCFGCTMHLLLLIILYLSNLMKMNVSTIVLSIKVIKLGEGDVSLTN